ncbi:hypothetical protein V8E55_010077 [Tylopilus felleus]
MLATSVKVSTTSSITFTPDAAFGPNGKKWNPSSPQYPVVAFSAKFTTYHSSFWAEINGQSTTASGASATGMAISMFMSGMSMPMSSAPASTNISTSTNRATKYCPQAWLLSSLPRSLTLLSSDTPIILSIHSARGNIGFIVFCVCLFLVGAQSSLLSALGFGGLVS